MGKENLSDVSLLEAFSLDAKKMLPVLETISKNIADAKEDDFELFTVNAHGMKSALASIGETAAAKLALSLEKAGEARDRGVIQVETQVLLDTLRSILAKVGAETEYSVADKDENPAFLRECLEIIRASCLDYDDLAAKNALADLGKMFWTKETRVVLNKISEHILHSDFTEAAAEAENYLRKH